MDENATNPNIEILPTIWLNTSTETPIIPFTDQTPEQKIETVNNSVDSIQSIFSNAMQFKASDFKNSGYFFAILIAWYSIFKQFWLEQIISPRLWTENYMLIVWVISHLAHRFIKSNPE